MKRQYKVLITVLSVVTVLLLSCFGVSADAIPSTTEIGVYYYPLVQESLADEINNKTVSGLDFLAAGNGQIYFDPNFVLAQTQKYGDVNYKPLPYYEALGVKVFFRVTSKGESRDGLEGAEITLEFDDPFVFKSDSLYTVSLRVGTGCGETYNLENPLLAAGVLLSDDNSNTDDISIWNDATPISTNGHQVTDYTFSQKQMSTLDNISKVRFQYFFDHAIDDDVQCIWFSHYMRIEQTSDEIIAAKQSTGILGNKIDQSTNIIKGHIDDATDKITGEIQDSTDQILHGWDPNPEVPPGSESVGELGSVEQQLQDSSQEGIDAGLSMISGLGQTITRFNSGLMFFVSFSNRIMQIEWLSSLLTIGLAIGIVAFLLNISGSIFSKISRENAKRNGGNQNKKR